MRLTRLPVGVLMLLLTASQAQAQVALRWKWNQGEELAYELHDNYASRSTVDQEVFELTQDLTLDTTWRVKSVSPRVRRISSSRSGREIPCEWQGRRRDRDDELRLEA